MKNYHFCLAVLTTEVKTVFHLKNQGLAAFLDRGV
jgi:hypothetical protein